MRWARASSPAASSRPNLRVRAPVSSSVVASLRLSADSARFLSASARSRAASSRSAAARTRSSPALARSAAARARSISARERASSGLGSGAPASRSRGRSTLAVSGGLGLCHRGLAWSPASYGIAPPRPGRCWRLQPIEVNGSSRAPSPATSALPARNASEPRCPGGGCRATRPRVKRSSTSSHRSGAAGQWSGDRLVNGRSGILIDPSCGTRPASRRATGRERCSRSSNALLAMSVIISLFGIVNTLVLSVYVRMREIDVLRAVGTTWG